MHDVIIIGGGVIGLSIARELAPRKSVLVLDRGPTGSGTSWAAAGMLSPLSEADHDGPFFRLSTRSFELYEDFARSLAEETGIECGYSDNQGVLTLATSDQAEATLERRAAWQREAGFDARLLSSEEVRRLEPMITARVRNALFTPRERSVAPRKLVNAIRESCLNRNVNIQTGVVVDSVASQCVRVGQTTFEAPSIVVASGVWSGELKGLDPQIPVEPRKGQILSIATASRQFSRIIRWQHTYFVPRASGEVIVGATEESAGFDQAITPAGIGQLLNEAQQISSHVGAASILEMWTGLRPATPDRLPILGPSSTPGVYYATGHYRNGVLLAPITARIIAALIENQAPEIPIDSFLPSRFQGYRFTRHESNP
jgi:glycine oxidase